MSALQVTLVLVGGPVLLYGLIWLLVLAPTATRRPRYRAGQPWPYQPLWWTANPVGAPLPPVDGHEVAGERGGARGNW